VHRPDGLLRGSVAVCPSGYEILAEEQYQGRLLADYIVGPVR